MQRNVLQSPMLCRVCFEMSIRKDKRQKEEGRRKEEKPGDGQLSKTAG